jgi:hypothetical protein|tara:strand:- start:349 stop:588 length:240 start_codon:yes stop_codon:yes gene_type:complete
MKIKMNQSVKASANAEGSVTMIYEAGQEYDMTNKMNIATILLNAGQADKAIAKTEKKVIEKVEKKSKNIVKKIFGKKKK